MPRIIRDDRVYQTVCDLIVESGIGGMTTRTLAERAGINEATLFRKYESKTALILRAVNHTFAHAQLAALTWTGDLESDIISIVENYIVTQKKYGSLMQVLAGEIPRYPELAHAMDAVRDNIRRIGEILERYIQKGRLRGGSGMELFAVLLAPLAMMVYNPLIPDFFRQGLPEAERYARGFLRGYAVG